MKNGVVKSVIPLSSGQKKVLEDLVSKILKDKVSLKEDIDQEILGGFSVIVEDWVLDATTKTELRKLNQALKA